MAIYRVEAPNGIQVTVSHSYGSRTFKHGELVDNDKLAVLFPALFRLVEIPVPNEPVVDTAVEPEQVIEHTPENIAEGRVEEEPRDLAAAPVKKAGRPAGAKNKPKSTIKAKAKKKVNE